MNHYLLGFDIGGTKCAVNTASWDGQSVELIRKEVCSTRFDISPKEFIEDLCSTADQLLTSVPDAIGISCGGPLDADKGLILSPPNLPGWDKVPIVQIIQEQFNAPVYLQNDANACALAEWRFGAGRGTNNMVFLTFGTGLGAGLILNGKLYAGANGNAGELGHIRLEHDGPVGFGKAGSFEGFCSGAGIAKLGYSAALDQVKAGKCPTYFREEMDLSEVSAKSIAEAAAHGDETALKVFRTSGHYLGKGLAMVIDILNPELIVIGSIFTRCQELLWQSAKEEIVREALKESAGVCRIAPASLGEEIGDYAAIATAIGF